jgi:hypothetical protein
MVQYQVKPDLARENEQLVRAVFDELHATATAGLRYVTLMLEGGVTFVHLVTDERGEGPAGWRSVVSSPSGGEIAFWQRKRTLVRGVG